MATRAERSNTHACFLCRICTPGPVPTPLQVVCFKKLCLTTCGRTALDLIGPHKPRSSPPRRLGRTRLFVVRRRRATFFKRASTADVEAGRSVHLLLLIAATWDCGPYTKVHLTHSVCCRVRQRGLHAGAFAPFFAA